ncbi:hypothetical protein ABBQ38_006764 [Trebouxia sp. C0009 RCD-2024]
MTQSQKTCAVVAALVILGWLSGFKPWGNIFAGDDGQAQIIELSDTAADTEEFPLFQQKQLQIGSLKGLLCVLETVEATPDSLGRLQNQLKTLLAFFDVSSLAEFILVTSEEDAAAVKQAVQQVASQHPQTPIPAEFFKYLTYADCTEQLDASSSVLTAASTPAKQQLARLSCAPHIKTPFYLNLDIEAFFTRSSNALSFFKESDCHPYSAVCSSETNMSYQAANDIYPIMERGIEQQSLLLGSAALLRIDIAIDWGPAIGVTPQVFATDLAKQVGIYVQNKFQVKSWQSYLLEQAHPDILSHRRSLSDATDDAPVWDAFNVYWLFATRACVFENFHVPGSVLQASAVWSAEAFHAWMPCQDTFQQAPKQGVVSLVHPSTNVPPADVWAKIEPCLQSVA